MALARCFKFGCLLRKKITFDGALALSLKPPSGDWALTRGLLAETESSDAASAFREFFAKEVEINMHFLVHSTDCSLRCESEATPSKKLADAQEMARKLTTPEPWSKRQRQEYEQPHV